MAVLVKAPSEGAAKFQWRLAPALLPSFLQFHHFFLPPRLAPAAPTPITFSRVAEYTHVTRKILPRFLTAFYECLTNLPNIQINS